MFAATISCFSPLSSNFVSRRCTEMFFFYVLDYERVKKVSGEKNRTETPCVMIFHGRPVQAEIVQFQLPIHEILATR